MAKTPGMRPQDIVVLLGIEALDGTSWRQLDLARLVALSASEVTESLERSKRAGLIDEGKRKVRRKALLEFIEHGLRYVFPAEPGALVRGVPTAHSAAPLSDIIKAATNDAYVWPHANGTVRGQAITPLYPTVPTAVENSGRLHELLALADAMRVGRARERTHALHHLQQRLNRLDLA
jgi:hypothetical protein